MVRSPTPPDGRLGMAGRPSYRLGGRLYPPPPGEEPPPMTTLAWPAAALLLSALATAQTPGAIWTTHGNPQPGRGFVFADADEVYLSGGARAVRTGSTEGGRLLERTGALRRTRFLANHLSSTRESTRGLADGRYYFQVTDPSGSTLLSRDPIEQREMLVVDGVVRGSGATGTHELAAGRFPRGARPIQLAPFDKTPHSGNEYRVWITPVGSYDPAGTGFFGFVPKFTKTTSFVLQAAGAPANTIVSGFKFYDFNFNGVWEPQIPEEVAIPGWKIVLTLVGGGTTTVFTDGDGQYHAAFPATGNTILVEEVPPPPGFVPNLGAIWEASTPFLNEVKSTGGRVRGPDFGNVAFRQLIGGGRTPEYWISQEGRDLLEQNDPLWRNLLNEFPTGNPVSLRLFLRSGDGSIFTVPTNVPFDQAFEVWREFVTTPDEGFISFTLSRQLAASLLNNQIGFIQGRIRIDRFLNGGLELFTNIVAGAIGLLQSPLAAFTGPNATGQAAELRFQMENCYLEFTAINETGSVQREQVVYDVGPRGDGFQTPY